MSDVSLDLISSFRLSRELMTTMQIQIASLHLQPKVLMQRDYLYLHKRHQLM